MAPDVGVTFDDNSYSSGGRTREASGREIRGQSGLHGARFDTGGLTYGECLQADQDACPDGRPYLVEELERGQYADRGTRVAVHQFLHCGGRGGRGRQDVGDDLATALLYPVDGDAAEKLQAVGWAGQDPVSGFFEGLPVMHAADGQHQGPLQVGDSGAVRSDRDQERDADHRRPPVLEGGVAPNLPSIFRSSRRKSLGRLRRGLFDHPLQVGLGSAGHREGDPFRDLVAVLLCDPGLQLWKRSVVVLYEIRHSWAVSMAPFHQYVAANG